MMKIFLPPYCSGPQTVILKPVAYQIFQGFHYKKSAIADILYFFEANS
jgi:hypothetical protein